MSLTSIVCRHYWRPEDCRRRCLATWDRVSSRCWVGLEVRLEEVHSAVSFPSFLWEDLSGHGIPLRYIAGVSRKILIVNAVGRDRCWHWDVCATFCPFSSYFPIHIHTTSLQPSIDLLIDWRFFYQVSFSNEFLRYFWLFEHFPLGSWLVAWLKIDFFMDIFSCSSFE